MNLKELLDRILITTIEIRDKFPELYQHLNETPFFASSNYAEIEYGDFHEYLNTIQALLNEQMRHETYIVNS